MLVSMRRDEMRVGFIRSSMPEVRVVHVLTSSGSVRTKRASGYQGIQIDVVALLKRELCIGTQRTHTSAAVTYLEAEMNNDRRLFANCLLRLNFGHQNARMPSSTEV